MMVHSLVNGQEETADRKSKIYRPKLLRVMCTDEKTKPKGRPSRVYYKNIKWNQDKTGNARDR